MPGTWLISLILFLSLAIAPATGPAAGRRHEIQLRRNDYAVVAAPDRLQAAGFSKAILRVFSDDESKGGLYFASGLFPVVRPVLDQWAGAYSGKQVPLWAWMGVRKFAWLDDPRLLDRKWSAGALHPIPKLDLFNPQAQELIVKLFGQLARQQVQGILIQDDLTILLGEGHSNWGKASFSRATGFAADPRFIFEGKRTVRSLAWEDLRVRQVAGTLKRIVSACREANPAIQVGMNVHYEAPFSPGWARNWYAFDAAAVKEAGVDLYYLMAYHRQMKAERKLNEEANRIYFRATLDSALLLWGSKLVVKLQVRDWQNSELIPFEELKNYYDLIPAGVERVCFAAADPEDIDMISRIIGK